MRVERRLAKPSKIHSSRIFALLVIAASIAACGGGGGGGSSVPGTGTAAPTDTPSYVPPTSADGTKVPWAGTPGGPGPSANKAPAIGGSPNESVLVGSMYNFVPKASDADGDALTFSVFNLPRWATFDSTSGRLRGIPGPADLGRYDRIEISATDGDATTTLGPFAVDVVATALGTITLSWVAATEREDGSVLEDVGAHRIYWGQEPGDYPHSVLVEPGITTYVIDGLTPGTYYVAMTTIDEQGLESELSDPVRVEVT